MVMGFTVCKNGAYGLCNMDPLLRFLHNYNNSNSDSSDNNDDKVHAPCTF